MTSGSLVIRVLSLEPIAANVDTNQHVAIKVTIGNQSLHTKSFQPGENTDQTTTFELLNVDPSTDILFETTVEKKHGDHKDHKPSTWKVKLSKFQSHLKPVATALKSDAFKIHLESKYTPKPTASKAADDQAKEPAPVVLAPPRTLAVTETHRPWFMRVSYYYDTTKSVYNYTTSFRVLSSVARLSENTANSILQKVTGKTLADLDGQLVAPGLNTLDDTVDKTITTVFVKLMEGQSYVLKKKDAAVTTASGVLGSTLTTAGKAKDYTTSTVSGVVGSTFSTVGKAKDYTTSSVKSVASSTYNTVASVTDYTTTQAVNVSSSAYGKVRGATLYVAGYLPIVGAKIRA